MANCEKILIVGFAGAGKSTLLAQLNETTRLGWSDFRDLDPLVLIHHGKPSEGIKELIARVGWEEFRRLEELELDQWIENGRCGVIALGGGTLTENVWKKYHNRPEISFVYLEVDFEECWRRIESDKNVKRPHLQSGKEHWEKIYLERREIFNRIPLKLDGKKLPVILAKEVWKALPLKKDS